MPAQLKPRINRRRRARPASESSAQASSFFWLAGVALEAVNALKAPASGIVFRCCVQEGVLQGRRGEGVQVQITQWVGGQDRTAQHRLVGCVRACVHA